jgi:hypothetical protein
MLETVAIWAIKTVTVSHIKKAFDCEKLLEQHSLDITYLAVIEVQRDFNLNETKKENILNNNILPHFIFWAFGCQHYLLKILISLYCLVAFFC